MNIHILRIMTNRCGTYVIGGRDDDPAAEDGIKWSKI